MQIVRDLAGYTLGRSDLLRRAMSKKKSSVMEKERQSFVYGNEEENVPGCVKNGISEAVANKIYDEMIDFAKYAFNKSHAAAYAVVSYQTAFLKYYHPVEFMAALITSVTDFPSKVSGYIMVCRNMGICILPPDINEGEAVFSVKDGAIRFGLTALKNIGAPVVHIIIEERRANGRYQSFPDFIERMSRHDGVNKKVLENLIKAGAFDTLEGTRKQFLLIYPALLENANKRNKDSMAGQLSLFDIVDDDIKKDFEVKMPDVGEFDKETLLAFEKEVLGIYVSGHPLESDTAMMQKVITNPTSDFMIDEETNEIALRDGATAIIGGLLNSKTIKHTRNDQMMAFITIEDMVGTVEVIIFPRDYEKYSGYLVEDSKLFIKGRVSLEDEKDGRLICEKIIPFDRMPRELWIKFDSKEAYLKDETDILKLMAESEGNDSVVIYVENPKAVKRFGKNQNIKITEGILCKLTEKYGENRVKVVEKGIANLF